MLKQRLVVLMLPIPMLIFSKKTKHMTIGARLYTAMADNDGKHDEGAGRSYLRDIKREAGKCLLPYRFGT